MPLDQIVDFANAKSVEGFATEFGQASMGDVGAIILPVCIAVSTFGAANGSSFSGGRLVAVSARNGDFPAKLAIVTSKDNPAPARAIMMQSVLAGALLASGSFEALLAGFSVAAWIFYLVVVTCLLTLRWREPARHRPFRVWIVAPLLFTSIAVVLVFATIAGTLLAARGLWRGGGCS
jgi:L-type amino acid transporter 9